MSSETLAVAFRRNVRERMTSLGMSQAALAARMQVTPAFVSQMLSGHRNPGLNSLEDFARALDTSAADLLVDRRKKNNGRPSLQAG